MTFGARTLKKDIYTNSKKEIEKNILQVSDLFALYQDEFSNIFKKIKYRDSKKMVIFNQMIKLVKKEQDVIYTFENELKNIQRLNVDIKSNIQDHLFDLTNYDEKIFLKYQGKLKAHFPDELQQQIKKQNKTLIDELFFLYSDFKNNNKKDTNDHDFLLSLISSLLELSNELEKLDKLVYLYTKNKKEA